MIIYTYSVIFATKTPPPVAIGGGVRHYGHRGRIIGI
jgi:hypothetical protein